ncbi:MAG: hypothetical protein WBF79_06805 [Rhodococcus sp. (in: high G+C Gram-positive bacteria)]
MSWTSSPKDSVLGLAVLLYIGTALVVPIGGAALAILAGEPYEVVSGWLVLGVFAFGLGAYATMYSIYGLYLKLVSSHRRRIEPALSARFETGAVILAWVSLIVGLTALVPVPVMVTGLAVAALFSVVGGIYRWWSTRRSAEVVR